MPFEPVNDDLAQQVIRIIADKQRIPVETVTLDSTFEELKIDSLDGINIIFAVEEKFDINVPDEGVHTIRSVRDMVNGVRSLIDAKVAKGAAKQE